MAKHHEYVDGRPTMGYEQLPPGPTTAGEPKDTSSMGKADIGRAQRMAVEGLKNEPDGRPALPNSPDELWAGEGGSRTATRSGTDRESGPVALPKGHGDTWNDRKRS